MRIVNVMSSKVLGGSEQAFLNYNSALSLMNHEVFAIFNRNGKIKEKLQKLKGVSYLPAIFFKPYFLLFPYFYFKIKSISPDLIIVQSRKVLPLFAMIGKILNVPVSVVSHANKTKLLHKADYVFSITQFQKDFFIENGFDKDKVFVIPNLIEERAEYKGFVDFSKPPVFGVMARFDPMKGLSVFVKACGILKRKGIDFKAKIGGTPQKQYMEEYNNILKLIEQNNLKENVELTGWVVDKKAFYDGIDVFVMSSVYEPFGIVLLEAMMYSKPIISSLAEGPSEIFRNNEYALTFDIGDYEKLAELMIKCINNKELVKKNVEENYNLVNSKYTLEEVSKNINQILMKIVK